EQLLRDELGLAGHDLEWAELDVLSPQRGEGAGVPGDRSVDRGHTESRGQEAVRRGRNPTALHVTEHGEPAREARALVDGMSDVLADLPRDRVAVGVYGL